MIEVNISITYNENSPSKTVLSLRDAIKEVAIPVDCDYRKILAPRDDLDEIFQNENKMTDVFQEAKKNSKLFLQNKENPIDCLILSGNPAMIDERLFGKHRPSNSGDTDLARAIAEMALIQIALEIGTPILGICGGLQILNVFLGGSIKYLNRVDLTYEGHDNYSIINLDPDSIVSKAIKVKSGQFFASHYQTIDDVGGKKRINEKENYLSVVGRSENPSKEIAIVESQFGSIVVGIQDHPEIATNGYASPELPEYVSSDIYKATGEVIEINKRIFNLMIEAAATFKLKRELNNEIISGRPHPSKQTIYKDYMQKIKKSLRGDCNEDSNVSANVENKISDQKQDTNCLKEITRKQLEKQFSKLEKMSLANSNAKLSKVHWEGLFNRLPTKNSLDDNTDNLEKLNKDVRNKLC